jgi:hypothetical protein
MSLDRGGYPQATILKRATKRNRPGWRVPPPLSDLPGEVGQPQLDPGRGKEYPMQSGSSLVDAMTWCGIAVCLSQSAMFSGLNLAFFGLSRLRLEVAASGGNRAAEAVLELRKDSHFLLTTILWGNVAVNVLLTLLSNSVLAGVSAFLFSTVIITFAGEIMPQAYFSRHALKMSSILSPVLRFYQWVLYIVAKPCAKVLDWWLGQEGIQYFRERDLRFVIRKHIEADEADVDHFEGVGALNFLALDDLPVSEEGEPIDPESIISLPAPRGPLEFPPFERLASDPFLQRVESSGKKWVILTDPAGEPRLVLDADGFLRSALFGRPRFNPYDYCHRPIVVRDAAMELGQVVGKFRVHPEGPHDDVVDQDVIVLWGEERRVITGADILGRLLSGIASRERHP